MYYHLKMVLDYIADCEREDFEENPSDGHVYYHMMIVYFGREHADTELEKALADL